MDVDCVATHYAQIPKLRVLRLVIGARSEGNGGEGPRECLREPERLTWEFPGPHAFCVIVRWMVVRALQWPCACLQLPTAQQARHGAQTLALLLARAAWLQLRLLF